MRVLALVCALSTFSNLLAADPADEAARCREVVQAFVEATYAHDADTIVKLSHPKAITTSGGEEAMREQLERVFRQMRETNLKLLEFKAPGEIQFLESDLNEFAVVPIEMLVEATVKDTKSRVLITTFELGIRKIGEQDWRFVDGSILVDSEGKSSKANKVFPDFPSDLQLPKVARELKADGQEPQDPNKEVQALVKQCIDATYGGDAKKLLALTHPRVIELLGGPETALTEMTKALEKFRAVNLTLVEFSLGDTTFLKGTVNEFCIVPTEMTMSMRAGDTTKSMHSVNYQFGARKIGESQWGFIDGSRINQSNVRTLFAFADFPQDYDFPKIEHKRLDEAPAK